MKKIIITLTSLLFIVGCVNSENEIVDIETKSIRNYNYKDSELLKISSILLSDNSNDIKLSSRNSVIDKTTTKNSALEIENLNLGEDNDSLIIAVKNKKTNVAVILSKDKRLLPVLGYVENFDPKTIPPQMAYFLSRKAEILKIETERLMQEENIQQKLENIDANINAYFKEIAEKKVSDEDVVYAARNRGNRTLNSILRNESVVSVKKPLIKTSWRQYNTLIDKQHKNESGVEGCVTTALGQVLNYWGNNVKKITFGNPYGGSYYNHFSKKSFSYPYKNNATKKDPYTEIQYNISEQITKSHSTNGRGAKLINQIPGTKDVRTFIKNNVFGVKVADYTGYMNMINSDEHYVIKSVNKNRPAIVGGDGHAWVIDGLVKIRVKRGFWPIRWTEHRYYVHMNWGWGESNQNTGWFFTNGSESYDSPNGTYEIKTMISIAPN